MPGALPRSVSDLPRTLGLMLRSPQAAGLTDQSIVSAGNFTLIWILARKMAITDYGLYVMIMGLILSLNSVQSALIVFPLMVRYAGATLPDWQSGVVRSIAASLATAAVQIPVVLAGCFYLGHVWAGAVAVPALCLWQVQEIIRRAMFQRELFRRAVLGDVVRYVTPALLAVCLPAALLSTGNVLMLVAVCSIAASLLCTGTFATSRALNVSWVATEHELRESWKLGHSIILFNAFGSAFAQGSVWMLGNMQGLSAASEYQAVSNVMGVTNPPVTGIAATLVPAVARAYTAAGSRVAIRQSLPYLAAASALVVPLLVIFALAPQWTLLRFYGSSSPYRSLIAPLRIAALAQGFAMAAQLAGSVLACAGRARTLSYIQTISSAVCLVVMVPAIRQGGLSGCLLTSVLFSGLALTGIVWILRQSYSANLTFSESERRTVASA